MVRPRLGLWIQRRIPRHAARSIVKSRSSGSVEQFLRKRVIYRRAVWVVAVVGCALLARADYQGWLFASGQDWCRYNGGVMTVSQVVDGETLVITCNQINGAATTVRLCGIDAPHDRELSRQSRHGSVKDLANRSLWRFIGGHQVRLQLAKPRDSEGRLIAYVYLSDGTMLNERLLAEGLATIQRHEAHRWHERFKLIQLQAKRDAVGVWDRANPSQM